MFRDPIHNLLSPNLRDKWPSLKRGQRCLSYQAHRRKAAKLRGAEKRQGSPPSAFQSWRCCTRRTGPDEGLLSSK